MLISCLVLTNRLFWFLSCMKRGIFVAGLREEIVASPEQVLEFMEFGECELFNIWYPPNFFLEHILQGYSLSFVSVPNKCTLVHNVHLDTLLTLSLVNYVSTTDTCWWSLVSAYLKFYTVLVFYFQASFVKLEGRSTCKDPRENKTLSAALNLIS